MSGDQPVAELHPDYSDKDATARRWSEAVAVLTRAEVFWLSTVRPDGRPHVTPLIGLWSDDALHFCTGPAERKARNLATNPEVVVTTGTNTLHQGFDVVVEGRADRVTDEARLTRPHGTLGGEVRRGLALRGPRGRVRQRCGGRAEVFEVVPRTAFGFAKGEPYSQTRWRFG